MNEPEVTIIILHRFDTEDIVRIEVGAVRDVTPLSKEQELGSIVYLYGGKRIHVIEEAERVHRIVELAQQVEKRGIN